MIKVLFADDESDILDQAKIFLEKEDESISVEAVSSAEKGLELLRKEDFDCIVSDYQMPEMDGLDFLETVRKDLDSDIPFIVFTGKGREKVAVNALNLGADRYLQKGGNPKSQYGVLADTIIQSVSHWRSRKRLRESEREKSLILDSASEIIAFHNKDHELVWANRAYAEATGKNLEELEGQKCYQAWLGNEEPCEECPVTEAIEVGEVRERVMSPVSEEDYWRLRGSPVRNDSGEIIGALETGVKITEKIEQEEELRERTEMLEGMLDGI
ncbi:MAG: response regulator, partial [Candidatus Hadarchaeota archaeon]